MTLSALIFDVDGTLSETEELHREAFNETFAAEGLDWHWDQALYAELLAVTGGKERIAFHQQRSGFEPALSSERIAALHAAKTRLYTSKVAGGGVALRPGIRRILYDAKDAGLRLAIATTTSRPNIDALLAAAAPLPDFDVIAAGDEVKAKKPAPDVYELALTRLGLAPEACLAIEDTENGLRSAMGAGLRCIITTSTYGGQGPFPGACAVITHLGDPGNPAFTLAGPPLDNTLATIAWLKQL
jgi:HAD superfamily hydrolase (TIGR01509 family)